MKELEHLAKTIDNIFDNPKYWSANDAKVFEYVSFIALKLWCDLVDPEFGTKKLFSKRTLALVGLGGSHFSAMVLYLPLPGEPHDECFNRVVSTMKKIWNELKHGT